VAHCLVSSISSTTAGAYGGENLREKLAYARGVSERKEGNRGSWWIGFWGEVGWLPTPSALI
jgi:hypothetical protein